MPEARPKTPPPLETLLPARLSPQVLVLDERLRVVGATPRVREWLRLGTGQGAVAARLPAAVRSLARAALRAPPGSELPEVRFSPRGPTRLRLQARALPVGLSSGTGFLMILLDLAEAEPLERGLEELQRLSSLGLLTAGLVHELKNALVPIKTFFDPAVGTDRGGELADQARRELQRIHALVEQVLQFSRTGRRVCAPVHVHSVLEEALRLVQRRIEERLLSLERRFEATADVVTGDAVQLQQAFLNVLLNAIEAMGAHGTLRIGTSVRPPATCPASGRTGTKAPAKAASERLCVSISDTGPGIAPEHLKRIFDPFFTTKPGGTGLGLAVARRIVQEHGGEITVESGRNQGTTFHVVLPLAIPR